MSRVFKFRAWLNEENRMIDWDNLHLETDENGLFIWLGDDEGDNFGSATGETEFELMQFTGLHDKNGVEIYEGDLIEHEMEVNGLWEPYEACEVVFDAECGIYCFKWDSPNLLTDYQNLTVIGNIYENPNLLEESE